MAGRKVLALVMAGGAGSRLEVLTEERAKPAMPYAGVYRLIDFPLSNCMHSRIDDVWIMQQYQPHSLDDHVANGRPWDLDRTYGGLRVLMPHQGREESGWHQGNADAIYRHKHIIRSWNPDLIVVLSADHVYKLDYRQVIEHHTQRSTGVTMVTTRVTRDDPGRFGVVEVDSEGRVVRFENKPESPRSDIVATEVFVFDARSLLETLDSVAAGRTLGEDDSLEDLADEVLPRMVKEGRAQEHRLDGYWRDVGTVDSYWAAHMELLSRRPPIRLDDPDWPVHTFSVQRPPARVDGSAAIGDSLVSPGCSVRGHVSRSVLGPGVVIEEGARVTESVILDDAVVEADASVCRAILDAETRVARRASVGSRGRSGEEVGAADIAVTGRAATVGERASVGPGERLSPGSATN